MIQLPTTLELTPKDAGKRAEKVILRALPELRESFVCMLLHRGKVLLGGRPLKRGERVPGKGRLELQPPDPRPKGPQAPIPNPSVPVAVRHEDPDVIVVEKPSGVAMHPGPQHGESTLQNGLVARFPELLALGMARGFGLVSRLDKDVSGLVVVARSARAHEGLVQAFATREVEKSYRALVQGVPTEARGKVETDVENREAASEWAVLEVGRAASAPVALLALHPLTGRKHQLRIHMAALGTPILGDKQHGPTTAPLARELGLRRIALHAAALAFRHPVSGERLTFESPWPAELEAAWRRAQGDGNLTPGRS